MYVKKVRRKCEVRGCKNTNSYAISKTREAGNSIIACKECLTEALALMEGKPVEEITFPEAPAVEEVTEKVEEAPEEKPKITIQRKK